MKIYSVTQVLGIFVNWAKIPPALLEAACQRGTDAHFSCSMYAELRYLFNVKDAALGYVESFIAWYDQNVSETIINEKRFTDEVRGFTGRPDFVFKLKTDEIILQDIKTPLAESKTWKGQLAAYHSLVTEQGGIKIDDMMSLRLDPNGGPAKGIRYGQGRLEYFNYFLSALNAFRGFKG